MSTIITVVATLALTRLTSLLLYFSGAEEMDVHNNHSRSYSGLNEEDGEETQPKGNHSKTSLTAP